MAKPPASYSAWRLCFLIGKVISSGFRHDAGTFLPTGLFARSDCSDCILASVHVRPRPKSSDSEKETAARRPRYDDVRVNASSIRLSLSHHVCFKTRTHGSL